jgi:hypothetical protein
MGVTAVSLVGVANTSEKRLGRSLISIPLNTSPSSRHWCGTHSRWTSTIWLRWGSS